MLRVKSTRKNKQIITVLNDHRYEVNWSFVNKITNVLKTIYCYEELNRCVYTGWKWTFLFLLQYTL